MDKQTADKIITEYLPKIYGFAAMKSFSYDETDELCADIVREVYISLLTSDAVYNLDGYIWRISEHTYSKYVSSKKKSQGISIDNIDLPYYDDIDFDEADEEVLLLRREIAFLTERRRLIVYLFYFENRSISYISRQLGIPAGTVKWHLNKARNELKEGFTMERKIGKLGLSPVIATNFGHGGNPGRHGGPEYYLKDKLNLNIVYSVYFSPKTKEEIAEELGMTLVFVEDKIDMLESNGFLVRTSGDRYTTYVNFDPTTYSLELEENRIREQLKIAEILAGEYAASVRAAISDVGDVYIPGGNRELLEAAAIFYGVANNCRLSIGKRGLEKYDIKTTDGGDYVAHVMLKSTPRDPDYVSTLELPSYWTCGDMTRWSDKYPSVYSWSIDSRLSSREGAWQNNHTSDYEYLYEYISGDLDSTPANDDKFARLRSRKFITDDGRVNIMVVKGSQKEFFSKIPKLDGVTKERFAKFALESAMMVAKDYPPQMQDLIVHQNAEWFANAKVAVMVMDILYENGAFAPLTENEKVTSNLIMFCDKLPQ